MELTDVIYGNVEIASHFVDIIKTPLFQRLNYVKQLGVMDMIFPVARGTRYQHCIGTYARARKMLDCLENNALKEFKIPKLYRLAVEIAALLHDVGHGPFSHAWEHMCGGSFVHENNGAACVDEIFKQVNQKKFRVLYENNNYGIALIKALILGDMACLPEPLPNKYHYIFDIVNNKRCGLDVDKWDYLKRDYYYLKNIAPQQTPMDWEDIFLEARIAADGSRIEYRFEDYEKIYSMFTARWEMHRNCYRQPKVLACEQVLKFIINRTNAKINGRRITEINAESDIDAFVQLTNAKVLTLIRADDCFQYLKDTRRIVAVSDMNKVQLLKQKSCKIFVVRDIMPGPGVMMPPDEHFQFYGDECKKGSIVRNNELEKIERWFLLA